jgi:hypothetical protein
MVLGLYSSEQGQNVAQPRVSGRIVDSIEAAAGAARQAAYMNRRKTRAEFERRFTAELIVLLLSRASANKESLERQAS